MSEALQIQPAVSRWRVRAAGLVAGLVFALCNLLPPAVPLQIVAFTLILYIPARWRVSGGALVLMGLYMGLGYTLPQVFYLRLPAITTAILILDLTTMSILLVCSAGLFIRTGGIAGTFATAACITVLDWANYMLIPLWGTAQSFGRSWSAYPSLILFESFTGMPGTVFVVAAIAASAAILVAQSRSRQDIVAAALILLLVTALANMYVELQKPLARVTVAAVGWPWTPDSIQTNTPAGFDALYARPITEAAGKGARLIVTPEGGLNVVKNTQGQLFDALSKLAVDNKVWLIVGYIDSEVDENRLVMFSPDGKAELTYTKTHIIPWMETWKKGTGAVAATRVDGVWVGGMICQDDNFTDMSGKHSREGTQVMAVPTIDWACVSTAHISNSLHRPIESGYALVRAAINGVSVITTAHGQVLARMNHLTDGPGYIVAAVPIYRGGTFYGKAGNWVVLAAAVFVVGYVVVRKRNAKNPEKNSPQIDTD
jgi:apolipoprotein N-acyltransferase